MNINVTLTSDANYLAQTGGGSAQTDCYVQVSSLLDERSQEESVIHEIAEPLLWFLPHEKIDEFVECLVEGLDQLRKQRGEEIR
jgi:hypothetical protein